MIQADIIHLASRAGFTQSQRASHYNIERFTKLVSIIAAAEREACALICEGRQTPGTASVAILNGAADAIRARGQA